MIVLAMIGVFCFFYMKLSIALSRSVKYCFEILMGDFTESVDCSW